MELIKLGFPKEHPPYKNMNPYTLLEELNKATKSKYDIEIVHVKYLMTKSKQLKML
jgi:hypothetical protein